MRDLSLAIPQGIAKRKTKTSISTYRLNLAILSSIVLLALVYLFAANSLGTKGYEIKKLDEKLRVLEGEQKNLQMQVSDLKSITRIQAYGVQHSFVQTTNATYLKDSDFALR